MNEKVEFDFKEMFSVLKKRAWVVALSAVLAAVLVFIYTACFVTPLYSARISVAINNKASNSSGDTGFASSDLAVAIQLANTYVEIIKDDVILKPVAEEYDLNLTSSQLRGMISAEVIEDTQLFRLEVRSSDPALSEAICAAIKVVAEREIPGLTQGSSPKFLGDPQCSNTPTSPNYTQNVILGALGGALLAAIGLIVASLLDVRVKGEEDLQKICPIPVLGMIPELTDEIANPQKRIQRAQGQKGGSK